MQLRELFSRMCRMPERRPRSSRWRAALAGLLLLGAASRVAAAQGAAPAQAPAEKDPYKDVYATYTPDFLKKIADGNHYGGTFSGWKKTPKEMELSSESTFYTLNLVHEDSRADALVEAALKKEKEGQFREALKMYQT